MGIKISPLSINKNNIHFQIPIFYLDFVKGLINVYTIRLIKHKNDRPHGIVSRNVGIDISILFSLFVQLDNVILS